MPDDKKIAKSTAAYAEKSPMKQEHCGNCNMFQKPNGCTLVKGSISQSGWCKFWERS